MKIIKPGEYGKKGLLVEYDAGYIDPRDNRGFISEMSKLERGEQVISEPLVLTAVLQKCNVENRNGRIYEREILQRELDKYQQLIREKRAIGEADHPESSIIAVDRISHNVLETWWDRNTVMGKLEILMSPGYVTKGIISCQGDNIANLIRKGIRVGVSSRGVGSLKPTKEGFSVVGEDFMLATAADIVADPSAPDAFVSGIMEGKEWVWDGGILREKYAEKTYKEINTLVTQKQLEEKKLDLFNDFLNNL